MSKHAARPTIETVYAEMTAEHVRLWTMRTAIIDAAMALGVPRYIADQQFRNLFHPSEDAYETLLDSQPYAYEIN